MLELRTSGLQVLVTATWCCHTDRSYVLYRLSACLSVACNRRALQGHIARSHDQVQPRLFPILCRLDPSCCLSARQMGSAGVRLGPDNRQPVETGAAVPQAAMLVSSGRWLLSHRSCKPGNRPNEWHTAQGAESDSAATQHAEVTRQDSRMQTTEYC